MKRLRFVVFGLSLVLLLMAAPGNSGDGLTLGQKFPNVKLKNWESGGQQSVKQNRFSFKKFKGKVVLVDFWASWCGPCKLAFPVYDRLYRKYRGRGFTVLGINVDDEQQAGAAFIKQNPVKFSLAFDDGKRIVERVGVSAMPTYYLLDRRGTVKFIHRGFNKGDGAQLEKNIKTLLRKKL